MSAPMCSEYSRQRTASLVYLCVQHHEPNQARSNNPFLVWRCDLHDRCFWAALRFRGARLSSVEPSLRTGPFPWKVLRALKFWDSSSRSWDHVLCVSCLLCRTPWAHAVKPGGQVREDAGEGGAGPPVAAAVQELAAHDLHGLVHAAHANCVVAQRAHHACTQAAATQNRHPKTHCRSCACARFIPY
jgi:hypothetical protein